MLANVYIQVVLILASSSFDVAVVRGHRDLPRVLRVFALADAALGVLNGNLETVEADMALLLIACLGLFLALGLLGLLRFLGDVIGQRLVNRHHLNRVALCERERVDVLLRLVR